ncbi:MAG TPA: lamin tail domain-containing protein [bacterium]|nr:lamin tail domain-containing protein [bacterium]
MRKLVILKSIGVLFLSIGLSRGASPGDVVINEIAWMGTTCSSYDEWIELYNNSSLSIDLTGWSLKAADGTPDISLVVIIPAKGYFLLERTDDQTIKDLEADQIYTGVLENTSEDFQLRDASGNLIDSVPCETNGDWFAGEKDGAYTMERIDSGSPGTTKNNWHTNDGITRNGTDAEGNPINGTPKAENSKGFGTQPEEEPTTKTVEVTSSPFFPYNDISSRPTEGKIKYNVPDGSRITLRIFDVRGRLVRVLIDQEVDSDGEGSVTWDGTDDSGDTIVPIGIYICHIEALNENTGKVTKKTDTIVVGRKLR